MGDIPSVAGQSVVIAFRIAFGSVDDREFHLGGVDLFIIFRAEPKPLLLAVRQTGDFLIHQRAENTVGRRQYFAAGTEIAVEIDQKTVAVLFFFSVRQGAVAEKRVVGKAETVDALFDIAHGEELSVPRQQGKDLFLQRIDILIFIDQHFAEGFLIFPGQRRVLRQQFHSVQFQIAEVQRAFLPFFLTVAIVEVLRHFRQCFHVRQQFRDLTGVVRKRTAEQCRYLIGKVFLPLIPAGFDIFALIRIIFFSLGLFAAEGHGRAQFFPGSVFQLPQMFQVFRQCIDTGDGTAQLLHAFQIRFGLFDQQQHGVPSHRHTFVVPEIQIPETAAGFIQPQPGISLSAAEFHQAQDLFFQSVIAQAGTVEPKQIEKAVSVFLPGIGIAFFQIGREQVAAENGGAARIGNMKFRIQPRQQIIVTAQEAQAEGVNGGNGRVTHQRQLTLPESPRLALSRFGLGGDLIPHPFFHFPCRRPGKGQGQQLIDVFAVPQTGDDAFRQNTGLTAARRGGDEDITVANLNGAFLFRCKIHSFFSSLINDFATASFMDGKRSSLPVSSGS